MTRPTRDIAVIAALLTSLIAGPTPTRAQSDDTPDAARRVPWTTSHVTGSPDPPLPFIVERAFPALTFESPLDVTSAPGSERLFVVEVGGRIYSFPARNDVETPDLFFDAAAHIEGVQQVYALTFHPNFEQNRFCYICYIMQPEVDDGTRVARFRVSDTDPPHIEADSETTLITWLSGGHNGCCLKFGPDGYLYISTGDAAPANPPDVLRTGQDLGDLLSSILRIDVDHTEGDRNYRIPDDNPFLTTSGARGEIWAYGFRNPWRMSFDRESGDLWVGDVGWELWELLFRVERGGNYGWAVVEGRQPTNPEWPRGPTPILPPTVDHPHSEAASITGGLTYYGSRLPDLTGTYIYGDYQTGKIWGLRYRDGAVHDHRELIDTTLAIVGFGEDPSDELFILDHTGGTIHRLAPNPNADAESMTGIVAMLFASSGMAAQMLTSPMRWLIILSPLAIVFAMSFGMNRMKTSTLQMLFWAFAFLMGLSMSSIFLVFTGVSIAQTFFAVTAAFMGLSLYGYTTKKDLSGWGTFLIMGVVGLLVAMVINLFMQSTAMHFAISAIGVLLFAGLTAYDTQKIKSIYFHVAGTDMMGKAIIMGALSLYLDFINMFQFLLSFMGSRE